MFKKSLFIIAVSLLISFILLNGNVLAAAEDNAPMHCYGLQLFDKNQNFTMPKNSSSFFFKIPKYAVLNDDCYVIIHYAISNTLINELSNMSLSVNDIPITTELINNIQKTYYGFWKINIPLNTLKLGELNTIKIESNHRSIIGDCADIDNLGNWVTLYNDSKLYISDKSVYSPSLSEFYSAYFEDFSDKQSLIANFVLPKSQNNNLVSNLLKLSSSIGGSYPDRTLINYNVTEGDLNQKFTVNSIFIAPTKELKENKSLILPKTQLTPNQGFLSISDITKETPYFNTVISGENSAGIGKATDFISNNALLNQVKSNSLAVDSNITTKYNKFIKNEDGIYKFSDWGYSDINLAGAFHQKTSFSFFQPNGVQAAKGSYINLKFKHSKILLSDNSLITIYIDGKVINSSKLSESNSEDGNLKVEIPDSALKKSIIKVDIEVYNYIGKIDCSKDYYDSAWTCINSDSEIRLIPGKSSIQPSLDNFPYFNLYNTDKQPKILISFSKNTDNDNLNVSAIIASRIGQNFKETFDFDILNDNTSMTKEQKDTDMIFIGSFNNINLPDKIKNSIPIIPLGNNKFKIKENLNIVPEILKNKTIIQVIRSPWNFYKRIYVIAYDNNSNIKSLQSVLSNMDTLQKISEQISIIDNTLSINNVEVNDPANDKIPVTFSSIVQMTENKSGLPWWILLIALILIIISIIAIIRLKKQTNQFQDAGNKIKKSQSFKVQKNKDKKSDNENTKKS